MVRPRGFEPLAYSFGDCRSIQLSYGRTFEKVIMTPVRFSMAVLAAIVLFAGTAPAQKAGILRREYQARRDALSKSIRCCQRALRTVKDIEMWMAPKH